MLKYASTLADVDARMTSLLTPDKLADIVELIPESWLTHDPGFAGRTAQREAYLNFFILRMRTSHVFVQEAIRARSSHL